MYNKTNAKPVASSSDHALPYEKGLNAADSVAKVKTETIKCNNEFETFDQTNIKQEANIILQNEEQYFSINFKSDVKNDTHTCNYGFEINSKLSIKEEPIVPDTELESVEYFDCTDFATKLENDTMTANDCEMQSEINCRMEESVSDLTSGNDWKPCLVDLKKIEKCTYICSYRGEETEIDWQSPPVPVISQANDNVESDSLTAEDLSSEPLRFTSGAVYRDSSSNIYDVRTSNENISMRPNISSLNCDPACGNQQFELVETVVDESQLIHKCSICRKKFNRQWKLNKHSLSHSKPFKCEHCEKRFTHESLLKTHALLHSGLGPYKCEHCDKCFTSKPGLNKHILLHSGTKPFKCEHCHKSFTQKTNLKTHALLHVGTKSYKCEKCEKCFTHKSSFNRHVFLHLGTKPHKCEHCHKCFTLKSHLKAHLLLHSK